MASKSSKHKLKSKSKNIASLLIKNKLVLFAVIFAAICSTILIVSHAAAPTVSLEPETSSSIVAPAIKATNDSTASGSGYVQFNKAATGGSDPCTTFPALPSVKPDLTNTGVPAGTTLTNSSSIDVNTAGTIIDSKNVTGYIHIHANNVTVKNTRVNVNDYYGIHTDDGLTGVKVLHSEVYTTAGGYEGIIGDGITSCANYIHGFENGMTIGNNNIVQASLIEKLQSDSTTPHYDGIEVYWGNNIKIWGNDIKMTDKNGNWLSDTGAVNVTGQFDNVSNVDIRGNWLGGGSNTLNLDNGQGFSVTGVSVIKNTIYGSPPFGHANGVIRQPELANPKCGNVWSDTGLVVSDLGPLTLPPTCP